jgi:DNA mismatch repair protein MutH
VVFRKTNNGDAILEKVKFWNYPSADMEKAKEVWTNTVDKIKKNEFNKFTKISDKLNIHVRPHGRNNKDRIETPDGHTEVKRCFWLNAKYIQEQLGR